MAETVRFNLVIPYRFGAVQDKHLRDMEARQRQAAAAATLPPVCGKCGERIPGAVLSGVVSVVRTYDEVLRDTTESFLLAAAHHVYGDAMPKTDQKIWRRLHEQLVVDDVHVLEMDGTAYEWLLALMKHDKVKVHPADVSKFATLLELLESAERIPADVPAPAAAEG